MTNDVFLVTLGRSRCDGNWPTAQLRLIRRKAFGQKSANIAYFRNRRSYCSVIIIHFKLRCTPLCRMWYEWVIERIFCVLWWKCGSVSIRCAECEHEVFNHISRTSYTWYYMVYYCAFMHRKRRSWVFMLNTSRFVQPNIEPTRLCFWPAPFFATHIHRVCVFVRLNWARLSVYTWSDAMLRGGARPPPVRPYHRKWFLRNTWMCGQCRP